MKSNKEIEELKKNWCHDPCWDIETTEGFEDHHDELLQFSIEMNAKWDEEYQDKIEKMAERMGIPGNFTLAKYIDSIEHRIEYLGRQIERMGG